MRRATFRGTHWACVDGCGALLSEMRQWPLATQACLAKHYGLTLANVLAAQPNGVGPGGDAAAVCSGRYRGAFPCSIGTYIVYELQARARRWMDSGWVLSGPPLGPACYLPGTGSWAQ